MKTTTWQLPMSEAPDTMERAMDAAVRQLKTEMKGLRLGVDFDVRFGTYYDDVGQVVHGWVKAIPLKL